VPPAASPAAAAAAAAATQTASAAAAAASLEPLRLLLVEPGDVRHVLKTIAQRQRHAPQRPLHFTISERSPEAIARHLLLLSVALDWSLPVRQRATLWLEVFGNALLQQRSARYVAQRRLALIEMLCGEGRVGAGAPAAGSEAAPAAASLLTSVATLAAAADFSQLRYRARDAVEAALKLWAEEAPFEATTLRDARLRRQHGLRYDHRNNLVCTFSPRAALLIDCAAPLADVSFPPPALLPRHRPPG
jgi:dynein assembly factor 3